MAQPILPTAITNTIRLAIKSHRLPLTAIKMPAPMIAPIPIQTAKAHSNFMALMLLVFGRDSSGRFVFLTAKKN